MVRKKKTPKNRLSKSAKYSEYKLGKLLECFAADVDVKQAAVLTKMSERTVRDRYADWRGKLLEWSMEEPDRFNGFGHLLLNADGTISLEVLCILVNLSRSENFRRRMAARYPKYKIEREPALAHILEFTIRRFSAYEPSVLDDDFKGVMRYAIDQGRVEGYLLWAAGSLMKDKVGWWVWKSASRRLSDSSHGFRSKRFNTKNRFARDLRYLLLRDTKTSFRN